MSTCSHEHEHVYCVSNVLPRRANTLLRAFGEVFVVVVSESNSELCCRGNWALGSRLEHTEAGTNSIDLFCLQFDDLIAYVQYVEKGRRPVSRVRRRHAPQHTADRRRATGA